LDIASLREENVMTWDEIEKHFGQTWTAIRAAKDATEAKLAQVRGLLDPKTGEGAIDSGDISVVVFGSLARNEWTSGSDLDWTLLVDGEADHLHAISAQKFRKSASSAGFLDPGVSGMFGSLTISHNLIHQIGGDDDSNQNSTRRMLMLLESKPVGRTEAYDRVVAGIIRRYLDNDYRTFRMGVPHFLLNDLHRFWRTMCVDYAYKNRERAGQKWALRVIKLRFSRKLIFAAGLLTCLQCDPRLLSDVKPDLERSEEVGDLAKYLQEEFSRSPLEVIGEGLIRYSPKERGIAMLDAYDEFLQRLDQEETRKTLEDLEPKSDEDHPTLKELKNLGYNFQKGMVGLFFEDNNELTYLIKKYGIF